MLDSFDPKEKKAILDHSTQSLNSIKSAPVTMAQQLLDRESYET